MSRKNKEEVFTTERKKFITEKRRWKKKVQNVEIICSNKIRKENHEEYRSHVVCLNPFEVSDTFIPPECQMSYRGKRKIGLKKKRKVESGKVVRRKVKEKRKQKLGENKRKKRQGSKAKRWRRTKSPRGV